MRHCLGVLVQRGEQTTETNEWLARNTCGVSCRSAAASAIHYKLWSQQMSLRPFEQTGKHHYPPFKETHCCVGHTHATLYDVSTNINLPNSLSHVSLNGKW